MVFVRSACNDEYHYLNEKRENRELIKLQKCTKHHVRYQFVRANNWISVFTPFGLNSADKLSQRSDLCETSMWNDSNSKWNRKVSSLSNCRICALCAVHTIKYCSPVRYTNHCCYYYFHSFGWFRHWMFSNGYTQISSHARRRKSGWIEPYLVFSVSLFVFCLYNTFQYFVSRIFPFLHAYADYSHRTDVYGFRTGYHRMLARIRRKKCTLLITKRQKKIHPRLFFFCVERFQGDRNDLTNYFGLISSDLTWQSNYFNSLVWIYKRLFVSTRNHFALRKIDNEFGQWKRIDGIAFLPSIIFVFRNDTFYYDNICNENNSEKNRNKCTNESNVRNWITFTAISTIFRQFRWKYLHDWCHSVWVCFHFKSLPKRNISLLSFLFI